MLSLLGFGTAAATAVTSASTTATASAASAASLATKALSLPGGKKIKGKLVEAAKTNVGTRGEVIIPKVVKYFETATAASGLARNGLIGGGAVASAEVEGETGRKHKGKPEAEVDVTGYELEKVLKCQTGKAKLDKVSYGHR